METWESGGRTGILIQFKNFVFRLLKVDFRVVVLLLLCLLPDFLLLLLLAVERVIVFFMLLDADILGKTNTSPPLFLFFPSRRPPRAGDVEDEGEDVEDDDVELPLRLTSMLSEDDS